MRQTDSSRQPTRAWARPWLPPYQPCYSPHASGNVWAFPRWSGTDAGTDRPSRGPCYLKGRRGVVLGQPAHHGPTLRPIHPSPSATSAPSPAASPGPLALPSGYTGHLTKHASRSRADAGLQSLEPPPCTSAASTPRCWKAAGRLCGLLDAAQNPSTLALSSCAANQRDSRPTEPALWVADPPPLPPPPQLPRKPSNARSPSLHAASAVALGAASPLSFSAPACPSASAPLSPRTTHPLPQPAPFLQTPGHHHLQPSWSAFRPTCYCRFPPGQSPSSLPRHAECLRLLPVTGQKELQTTLMPARHPPDSPSALLSEGPSPAPRASHHLPPGLLFSRPRLDLIDGCPIHPPRLQSHTTPLALYNSLLLDLEEDGASSQLPT